MAKEVTLNELAEMVHAGFEEADKKTRGGFNQMGTRLDRIDARLADIEQIILRDHLKRIERLEHLVGVSKSTR